MDTKINIAEILKGCPEGTKLWSPLFGEVTLLSMRSLIAVKTQMRLIEMFNKYGVFTNGYEECGAECLLFPSKENRDWSKFTAPLYKKDRFDPKTLVPFTKVLIWKDLIWMPTMFTFLDFSLEYPRMRYNTIAVKVIPYNNDTKHLIGKTYEAPEYYRYWED